MSRCGRHGTVDAKSGTADVWAGNPATQCAGQCAWPFAQPQYGPQGAPLVAAVQAHCHAKINHMDVALSIEGFQDGRVRHEVREAQVRAQLVRHGERLAARSVKARRPRDAERHARRAQGRRVRQGQPVRQALHEARREAPYRRVVHGRRSR